LFRGESDLAMESSGESREYGVSGLPALSMESGLTNRILYSGRIRVRDYLTAPVATPVMPGALVSAVGCRSRRGWRLEGAGSRGRCARALAFYVGGSVDVGGDGESGNWSSSSRPKSKIGFVIP
jgi:hypothetical protein